MQKFLSGIAAKAKATDGATRTGGKSPAAKKPASKQSTAGEAAARKKTSAKAAPGKTSPGGKTPAKTSRKSGSAAGKAAGNKTAGTAGRTANTTAAKSAKSGKSGKAGNSPGKKAAADKSAAKTGRTATGGTKNANAKSVRDAALTRHQLPLFWRVLILLAAFVAMVGFAVVLSKLTLGPSAASESLVHSNLRPGDSIRDYLAQPAFQDTLKQLGGNIVLGVPFGVLLPALVPRTRGLLRVMVATALVMLLVELVQGALVQGRAFDIDDVILNTTGAMLGYLILGLRLGRAVHPRRRHWWHRKPRAGSRSGSPQSPRS